MFDVILLLINIVKIKMIYIQITSEVTSEKELQYIAAFIEKLSEIENRNLTVNNVSYKRSNCILNIKNTKIYFILKYFKFKHKEARIELKHKDKYLIDKWLIRVEFIKEKPPKISVAKLVYSFSLNSLFKIKSKNIALKYLFHLIF